MSARAWHRVRESEHPLSDTSRGRTCTYHPPRQRGKGGHNVRADAPTQNEASARALRASTLLRMMNQPIGRFLLKPANPGAGASLIEHRCPSCRADSAPVFCITRIRGGKPTKCKCQRGLAFPTHGRFQFHITKAKGRPTGVSRGGGGTAAQTSVPLICRGCLDSRSLPQHKQQTPYFLGDARAQGPALHLESVCCAQETPSFAGF